MHIQGQQWNSITDSADAAECLDSAPFTPTALDSDEAAPLTPTAIVSDESAPLTPIAIESASLTPTAIINSDEPAQGQGDSLFELWDRGPLPAGSNVSSPDSQNTVIQHQREMIDEANRLRKRWQAVASGGGAPGRASC